MVGWRSEGGQGTVEWVGLVTLVLALLVALGAAGVPLPGTGIAEAVVAKLECALGEDSRCGSGSAEPLLVRAYGSRIAAEVRKHAPEVDYETGMSALPVDFRSCRGPVCGNGPSQGAVWRSNSGEPAAVFVHVVDCRRPDAMAMPGIHCDGRGLINDGDLPTRGGSLVGHLYIQYWLYYENSTSLRDLPGDIGYHEDDWESYQVRIDGDGAVSSRASSHNGYNYDGGIGGWPSDSGLFHRAAWGPATGRTFVSGGSHAGHVHEDGAGDASGGRRIGDTPLPTTGDRPTRWTPASHLELIPIETLGRRAQRTRFAITPPWQKLVYFDPEWEGT
jgi:hypothetical protein